MTKNDKKLLILEDWVESRADHFTRHQSMSIMVVVHFGHFHGKKWKLTGILFCLWTLPTTAQAPRYWSVVGSYWLSRLASACGFT